MSNVKPISDLNNYREVLDEVSVGSPVYLTADKGEKFVIMKSEELEELKLTIRLLEGALNGERSGREEGWIPAEEVERRLGVKV